MRSKRETKRKMTRRMWRMTRTRVMKRWWAKWRALDLGPSSFL